MATTDAHRPTGVSAGPPGPEAMALALYFVLSCTILSLASGGPSGADYELRWVLFASDLGLAGVVVTQLRTFGSRRSVREALRAEWSRHPCATAALLLAVSLLPSLAAHPSARGVAAVLRWAGVALVARAVGRLSGSGRVMALATFGGVTAAQVVIGLAERAGDRPVGLGSFGEPSAYVIGGRYASTGLTAHPYVLAAWCVLGGAILLAAVSRAGRPSAWLAAGAALPFAGVGLTMSRAGALAVAMVLAAFAAVAVRQPKLRVVVVAAALATAVGVGLDFSGWLDRAAGTAEARSASAVTSNRTQLVRQANGLFREDPVLGVGPGRYVEALERRPDLVRLATQRPSRPVHVTPYLVLVEGGLVALPALLLLAWAVVVQTRRGGLPAAAVTLAVVPFLVLDHLHWSLPQGLLLTGLWLGALDVLGRMVAAR